MRHTEMRAIRWLSLSHAFGIGLFVLLMSGFFWYVGRIEADQQRQMLYRDIAGAQTALRRTFRDDLDEIAQAAPEWITRVERGTSTREAVTDFLARQTAAVHVLFADATGRIMRVENARGVTPMTLREAGAQMTDPAIQDALAQARESLRPVHSAPFTTASGQALFELLVPVAGNDGLRGMVIVDYSLDQVLNDSLLQTIRDRYQIAIIDASGNTLVSSSLFEIDFAHLDYEVPLDPPGHGVHLRAFAYEQQPQLIDRALLAAIVTLSLAILLSLLALWRHAQRRLFAEFERDRLFTLSPDPLCIFEMNGSLVRGNPAFDRILGTAGPQRQIDHRVHPDDRPQVLAALEQIRRPGASSASFEARFSVLDPDRTGDADSRSDVDAAGGSGVRVPATPDRPAASAGGAPGDSPAGTGPDHSVSPAGHARSTRTEWRWLHWLLRRDPDAQRPLLYAVARDVTERRTAELALAAETAYRRAMENSMLTGMRAFDMRGRINYVNPAFCRMVGYTEAELVGVAPPYPYWPTDANSANSENLERVLAGDTRPGGHEVEIRRKDGSRFDARMYVSPLIDGDGHQTGWMTSITDVTEPKRIREQLAAAHERFITVLDELDVAVSVVARAARPGHDAGEDTAAGRPGEDGNRDDGSGSAIETDSETDIGTHTDGTVPGSGGQAALLFANRAHRTLFGADSRRHEELLAAYDGAAGADVPVEFHDALLQRWFDLHVRQIRWVDGRTVELLVATDTTRRHLVEEQQREQDRKLQRTSRLVTMGEMASSLAHELNQPLTAISNYCMGMAARIRSGAAANRPIAAQMLLEPLARTSAQAARAGEVIRRIRNFVKRSEPERRACDVRLIVADAVGLADIDARRMGLRIATRLPAQLPALFADPILIEQVLLNLLKNALDATRESTAGGRTVTLDVRHDGDWLEFGVTDQGSGLDDDTRERLFEPFFTTKSEGMGIGLNICRSIVESHKGRLWSEAAPGGGCSFRFTLPVEVRQGDAGPGAIALSGEERR